VARFYNVEEQRSNGTEKLMGQLRALVVTFLGLGLVALIVYLASHKGLIASHRHGRRGGDTNLRERRAYARELQRDWLQGHPELLARLPGVSDDVGPDQAAALDQARLEMVRAFLCSATADPDATRWMLRLLVSEVHGEPVGDAQRRRRHARGL
jgi:hypothetical protein